MNTRKDFGFTVGFFINLLSIASALNSCFVRSEKINELFCFEESECHTDSHEHKLANLIFTLLNVLSVTPEVIHNTKMNARLYDIVGKITGTDYRPQVVQDCKQKIKNVLTATAIIVTSAPVALGHGVMFYDANTHMFSEDYKITVTDENAINWSFLFSCIFGGLGATQHWLHGSMELSEGAFHEPSVPFFCNSHAKEDDEWEEWFLKIVTQDFLVNVLLLSAVFAEFGLFYSEFNHQITENTARLPTVNPNFLRLASVSFSCISASMYLGHEGQSFFKINKVIKQLHEKYYSLSLEELFQGQLYGLGCLSHAVVHSVTRYQALQSLSKNIPDTISLPVSLLSAGISGLSRLSMLCDDKAEEKDQEHNDEKLKSIKYDASERGKDVMYETFFIILIGILYLCERQDPSIPEKKAVPSEHVIAACSLAGLASQLLIGLSSYCCNESANDKHFDKMSAFIDIVAMPAFNLGIVNSFKSPIYADASFMSSAAQILMLSLLLRHGQKKFVSYPEVKDCASAAKDGLVDCASASWTKAKNCGEATGHQLSSCINSLFTPRRRPSAERVPLLPNPAEEQIDINRP